MSTPLPPLSPQFQFLDQVGPLPPMLAVARGLIGIKEGPGPIDNPVILSWADELGIRPSYPHDSIAWCGMFQGLCAHRAHIDLWPDARPIDVMWALNWAKFGVKVANAALGDILTFERHDPKGKLIGGHVAQYIAEDSLRYYCLGGNQDNQVCIEPIAKIRLNSISRHFPALPSVKPYVIKPTSQVDSVNEA